MKSKGNRYAVEQPAGLLKGALKGPFALFWFTGYFAGRTPTSA